ncbi:putative zinc-type alcohol dehydrogenase-like protein [Mollisia scopiformis]|uniref:Putative zinc-type alcohol dehydrogenase-like protein n=1 Tax=Mollisia scopiformis TaxID=149040 RepID=A0A194X942_MOLSC|nr:putative zinc-type alcohol dehydrogenase-like protein [Mollisia scopiformis]KUJ16691.1 putative zinc-type alcohol dehydrogenase-like protein [Mollisia scopiformis]
MATHLVYRLTNRGPKCTIKQVSERRPTPDKHEVLVKIHAVSLNYRDIVIANGTWPFPAKDNLIPCSDSAGKVVAIGSDVEGFAIGDKVVAAFDVATLYGPLKDWNHGHGGPIDGVLREYAAFPASVLVKIPSESKLGFPQLSTLVCTGVTAWNALYGNIPLKPGQTVLFQGTGGLSITGLILAKAAEATTIITSSSSAKLALVKSKYGVDHTINYKTTRNWAAKVNKITNNNGVVFILENGGSGTIKQSLECITAGGIISVIGFLSPAKQKDMPDVAGLALAKGVVVRGITVGNRNMLKDLVRFVAARGLERPVDKTFGFEQAEVEAAYEYLKSGKHVGKVCISLE